MHPIHCSPPSQERCSFQSHWSEHADTHRSTAWPPVACTHIHAHTQAYMYLHMHMHAATYMHTPVHMHAHMPASTVLMHVRHMYACMQLHTRACLHTTRTCMCIACPYLCAHAPTHPHTPFLHPPACPAPSTPPTTVHTQQPCVQTPPPLLCARLLLPITHTLTPACKQQPGVHTHQCSHPNTCIHTHTHSCDSSAHANTCTDPTPPPQPFESPSKLPLLLNCSSPGSTNQYSSPPPLPFSARSWALSNTSASECTSALRWGGDRDPISQGGGWGLCPLPARSIAAWLMQPPPAHPLGDGTDRAVLTSGFRVGSSSPFPHPHPP